MASRMLTTWSSLVVVVVCALVAAVTSDVVIDTPVTLAIYDPNTELCCQNKVYQQYSTFDGGWCCGDQHYDAMKYLCCDGVVTEVPDDLVDQYDCCGGAIYNTLHQLCCNGEVCDVPANCTSLWDCCPSVEEECGCSIYRVDRQICCNGKISSIPKDSYSLYECCPGDTSAYNGVYNYITQQCCWTSDTEGVVVDYPAGSTIDDWGFLDCCGTEIYDTRNNTICCDGHLVAAETPFDDCCGCESSYNSAHQLCCDGQVLEFPATGGGDYQCCNGQLYDKYIQKCCWDNSGNAGLGQRYGPYLTGCCGTNTYNVAYECCDSFVDGLVVPVTAEHPWFTCCNGTLFDSVHFECCGGEIIDLSEQRCCAGVPYDLFNQMCCADTIIEKPCSGIYECCGVQLYQPGYSYCCEDQILTVNKETHAPFHHRCCCGHLYEINHAICCEGDTERFDLARGERCCHDEGFDPHEKVCCIDNEGISAYSTFIKEIVGNSIRDTCCVEFDFPDKK